MEEMIIQGYMETINFEGEKKKKKAESGKSQNSVEHHEAGGCIRCESAFEMVAAKL